MTFNLNTMVCKYCFYPYCCKNGLDRRSNQRYKCKYCKKTFAVFKSSYDAFDDSTESENIRKVLHLILAGVDVSEISLGTKIPEKVIKQYRDSYLKNWQDVVHPKRKTNVHPSLYNNL